MRFAVLEPPRTSAFTCSGCQEVCRVLLHSFGVVQAQRTSANLNEPHQHRDASKVFRVLLH